MQGLQGPPRACRRAKVLVHRNAPRILYGRQMHANFQIEKLIIIGASHPRKRKKPSARGDSRWANNALRAGGRKRSALCKLNTTSEALFHTSGVDAKTTPKAPIRDYDRAAYKESERKAPITIRGDRIRPLCKDKEAKIAEQIRAGFVPRWAKVTK